MMPQNDARKYADSDSIVQNEVMNGLLAAKQYESNRTQLSAADQEELLKTEFPRLYEGDDAKQMTENECLELRTSMQDMASHTTTQSMANLREQLTEYHSLLDKLSSITANFEALEKKCQERDNRIQSLEQEVDMLKRGQQLQQQCAAHASDSSATTSVRRISLPRGGDQTFNSQQFPTQFPTQFQNQAPNPAFFQNNAPSFTQHHQSSAFTNSSSINNDAPLNHYLQAHTPFSCNMNDSLPPRQQLSPSPRMNLQSIDSTSLFESSHCGMSGFDCNNGYNSHLGELAATTCKRAISNEFVRHSGIKMASQQGNKRTKNECHDPWYMGKFHCPEAASYPM